MYHKFHVALRFRDRMYAGLPANKNILKAYVKAKFDSENTDATESDLDLEEKLEENTNKFRRDKDDDSSTGLIYMHAYQVNAMISQNASLLEYTTTKRGSKQTFAEGMCIHGRFPAEQGDDFGETGKVGKDTDDDAIRFHKNRHNIDADTLTGPKVFFNPARVKADGIEDFVGTVTGVGGKRSILKANEYVKHATVHLEIWILANRMTLAKNSKKITPDDLKRCIYHGQQVGLGSNRKMYGGQFDIMEIEDLGEDLDIQLP